MMRPTPQQVVRWPVTATSRRLTLAPLAAADFDAWRDGYLQRQPKQHRFDNGPMVGVRFDRASFRSLCARHATLAREDRVYILFARERRSGAFIGCCDISTLGRGDINCANLGYWVHNTYQGRGFGTELSRAAIKVAFDALAYHRLEAACRPENRRAIATARAAGLQREGIRRQYWLDDDGWADQVILSAVAARGSRRAKLLA
jgi:[ribosomal protein S5]-alanine N-acetyltransferase